MVCYVFDPGSRKIFGCHKTLLQPEIIKYNFKNIVYYSVKYIYLYFFYLFFNTFLWMELFLDFFYVNSEENLIFNTFIFISHL